ncbi:MAG: hypothetical protein CSA58_12135 [Micrococcales bacterium]|nr:MAG: hypothetical protein CSB46_00235 [Micrococcales bacterium]PIE25918.1 MAG: hypothetical protein CSA58_12135 [Micrococcales bacterium]
MPNTVVHLMRHGEVDNPAGILYGRLPGYGLSDLGRQMAKAVAGHLRDTGRDIVLLRASPLQRAQETAAPIAEVFDLQVEEERRIIEAENHFEGMRFGQGEGSLTNLRHWPHLRNPLRPSWGEPYVSQVTRVLAAACDAAAKAAGHEALVVGHQLPIWVTRRHLEGKPLWHDPRRRECRLASLTSLRFVDGVPTSVSYSEPAAHLYPDDSRQVPGT